MMDVMIVEDEKIIRLSLRKIIESEAAQTFRIVGEAKDGQMALAMLEHTMPQVIITDIRMPVMDGLSLIEQLQQRHRAIDFVILSGYDEFAYAKRAMRLGVTDYLLKPVDPAELMQTLERFHKRWSRREGSTGSWIRSLLVGRQLAQRVAQGLTALDADQVRREMALLHKHMRDEQDRQISLREHYEVFTGLLGEELRQREEWHGADYGKLAFTEDGERNLHVLEDFLLAGLEEIRVRRNWGAGLIVNRAIQYVETYYRRPDLKLQDMADDLSISTWYLSRVFKAETGQNFIHYLTEYRLQQARQLMSDPAAKLHEISEQVGYAEYAHFSRVFKKYYNLTPSEYKRFAGSAERVR